MTVTDTTTVDTTGMSMVPEFTMRASQLRDLLTGGVVAAGSDNYLPTLAAVLVHWTPGGDVTVVATDRYRLVVGVSDTPGHGDGRFLLGRRDAIELSKTLPKVPKRGTDAMVTVTLTSGHVTFRVDTHDGSMTREYRTVEGEFPKYEPLIPGDDKLTGTAGTGFSCNPGYLADVAKLPVDKSSPVTWRFQPDHRPAVATYPTVNGIAWTYLLMPVRIPN